MDAGDDMRFERRMSDSDALLWRIEKDPTLRSTITSVAVFDRSFDEERLLDRLERGSRLIPRLRQRVVSAPLSPSPPRWVVDPDFDLRYHLRHVRVAGSGSLRDVLDLAQPIAMQGFDRARPLWEFTVVDGLADGGAALIQKVHHSITDGVGGMKLAMLLLDLERAPSADLGPMPEAPEPEMPGWLERSVDSAAHEVRRQLGIAKRAGGNLVRGALDPPGAARRVAANGGSVARLLAPAFEPLSPVMQNRSLGLRLEQLSVALDDLKAAAHAVDGKLNDAFVASVAGGLRRYHERHGAPVDALRMAMPINVRSGATSSLAGNQFVPARFAVPVGIADPAERMRAINDLVRRQRSEPSLGFVEGIAGALNRLPTTLTTDLFGRMLKGVDFITSNVPGAPMPVYLAGARMEAQYAFGPLSGAAMNCVLVSYRGECQIGVSLDPAAVPDHEALLECLHDGFDEVRKVG